MTNPLAYLDKTNKYNMYFHQAMQQTDKEELLQDIIREVNEYYWKHYWELIPKEEIPKVEPILESVCAIKFKYDIITRGVYKYKARLNFHGIHK